MSTRPKLKRASTNDKPISPPPLKRKQLSTTTQKVVHNFFTPASKKPPEAVTWSIHDGTLLRGRYDMDSEVNIDGDDDGIIARRPAKVAAFDFDSTLVEWTSGARRNYTNWRWWHGSVPLTLKGLHEKGYMIVILSNQAGIGVRNDPKQTNINAERLDEFKRKVNAVLSQLELPISIYAATGLDKYRKPRTGMWEQFTKDFGLNVQDPASVDLQSSFFVGDAGGRAGPAKGKGRKDHSCVDRDLARNVGIEFKTPEEYFLQEDPRPFVREFDPINHLTNNENGETETSPPHITKKYPLDIILFCGSPGAGKSTFYWKYLKHLGYERVNQDILKTRDRCLHQASEYLKQGSSVAVDNTNADNETRAQWVKLAKKFEVPIRCVLFTASAKLCEHNDTVRALNNIANPESRKLLPKIAFTSFSARFREPTVKEGFEDIINVDFKFNGTAEHRSIWTKYWL